MKNIAFITLLLLLSYSGTAQVITPPFSRPTVCPIPVSIPNARACAGWWAAGGTPDYFNLCDPGPYLSVPQNAFGHQNAIDSGYYGLIAYDDFNEYKEYIGTTCAQLVVGHTYTVSIQASLAEVSGFASDGLGVFFSTYSTMVSSFSNVPQIDYTSYGPIVDSVNWVTLTSTFVADSAYTHLSVGCFKRRAKVNTVPIPRVLYGPWNNNYYSYYYIGAVGIADTAGIVPIDTTTPSPGVADPFWSDGNTYSIFPNAFTPNTDSKNDVFRLVYSGNTLIEAYSLRILNRWGELVFLTNDPLKGWDGTYKNQPCEMGAYFYLATFKANGIERVLKGEVTLVR